MWVLLLDEIVINIFGIPINILPWDQFLYAELLLYTKEKINKFHSDSPY